MEFRKFRFALPASIDYKYRFRFNLPSGKIIESFTNEFIKGCKINAESINCPVTIEYLPNKPEINRIKGTGPQTIFQWFRQKILGALFIFILFSLYGFKYYKKFAQPIKKK